VVMATALGKTIFAILDMSIILAAEAAKVTT
jgi:ERCC4-related helicase